MAMALRELRLGGTGEEPIALFASVMYSVTRNVRILGGGRLGGGGVRRGEGPFAGQHCHGFDRVLLGRAVWSVVVKGIPLMGGRCREVLL